MFVYWTCYTSVVSAVRYVFVVEVFSLPRDTTQSSRVSCKCVLYSDILPTRNASTQLDAYHSTLASPTFLLSLKGNVIHLWTSGLSVGSGIFCTLRPSCLFNTWLWSFLQSSGQVQGRALSGSHIYINLTFNNSWWNLSSIVWLMWIKCVVLHFDILKRKYHVYRYNTTDTSDRTGLGFRLFIIFSMQNT